MAPALPLKNISKILIHDTRLNITLFIINAKAQRIFLDIIRETPDPDAVSLVASKTRPALGNIFVTRRVIL